MGRGGRRTVRQAISAAAGRVRVYRGTRFSPTVLIRPRRWVPSRPRRLAIAATVAWIRARLEALNVGAELLELRR